MPVDEAMRVGTWEAVAAPPDPALSGLVGENAEFRERAAGW
jgi:hypothetical protein